MLAANIDAFAAPSSAGQVQMESNMLAAWSKTEQSVERIELNLLNQTPLGHAIELAVSRFDQILAQAENAFDTMVAELVPLFAAMEGVPADQASQSPHSDILITPASGPTIGDPSISAVEGVNWYGIVASIGDNDSDGVNGAEPIQGTINWGDGNSSPFGVQVPENGSANLYANHTWTEAGTYTVTITANDSDGGQTQTPETATVSDGALSWYQDGQVAPYQPPTWSQTFDPAPSLTTPANQTNTEDDNVSLQVHASSGVSYDAIGLPPGLSINSSTGLISGTVVYGAAEDFGGSYNPTVIVADGKGGSSQDSFSWTINPAQVVPVLTNPGSQTNLRGDSVSLQVSAAQVDDDPLTYSASNLPTGLSIDSETGLISGNVDPSAILGVPYSVTVTATDDTTNLSANQTFNWTISAANVAPALASPGNQINSAGDDVSLQLSATDADGDPLTYTAAGLPPGLILDPTVGTITGTLPDSAASSTPYNVTVTASDGNATSSQSFQWTVHAVSLQNPGDQSNLDGDSVSLQLTASDANNATITYSASGLPSGLSINSSSGLISGTIASNADTNSPYSATVTATDSNHDSVSQSFNWTVARVSLNPVGDQENQEDKSVSLQLSATDNEAKPTYSATGLPSGLSINSTTGQISGTVGIGAFGSSPYQVTVTATDGSSNSSQSFVWTVTPRVALVSPGPQSNATGDSVSLQLSATSPGGTMSYSATGLPSGLSISSSTGLISGTIPSTDASSTPSTVTVTANDGTSHSSQTFQWTISVINLESPGDQSNNDGDTVSLSMAAGYHGSGRLSYSATGLPTGLSINSTTGQITGAISGTADVNSPYSAIVSATDGTNTSTQTFNWTVNAVVSIDSIDDQSNAAGDVVSLQVAAADSLNDTLTYSASGLPSGLSIGSSTGLISGTIALGADTNSPYAVTVTATDSAGNSATQSFNWNISHVSLVNPGQQWSVDGKAASLQLQGHDADGNSVSYTASGLPSGMSLNTSTGLISGTIASNADTSSPYNVTVSASDGTHSTTQTFLWMVSQVSVTLPSNQTNTEGDNVSLQLQGAASSGTLSYNASSLPPGLSLNSSTGLISGSATPGDAANGPYTVDVSASNGSVSTSQTFTWNVNPVVNLTQPDDQNNNEGDHVSLQISATDSLHKTLTYTADDLPSGLSINSSTGLISGTVSSGDAENGPYAVTVTASDGTYSSSATFNWNVTHTDTTALTMTTPGTQDNITDDIVNLPINASDPDGIDTLLYSATGLPDGLDIDPFAGTISGTVADDAASSTPYQVTVTADDGNGQSVSKTFSMLVNPSPIIAQTSPISAVEGNDTGSITVATFTTADLNSQAGDYTAVVSWGDGNNDIAAVSGSNGNFVVTDDHTYAEKGSYVVSDQIYDTVTGGFASVASTATVGDAPLSMTGGFQYGDSYTDAQSGYVVATFTDGNPTAPLSDYTLSVNWGDGIITNGAAASYVSSAGDGLYQIVVPHNYANPYPAPGPTYTVTVTLTDVDGASAQVTDTVVVGDIVSDVPATMGTWAFVDQNTLASASDFVAEGETGVALINWGDGTTSLGTVSGSSGHFNIVAQSPHTYAQDSYDQPNGVYTITVTVTDDDGTVLTGQQYVRVVRPPVALYVNDVETPVNSLTLTNAQVAAFTVPDGVDASSEFSASINWGDDTTSNGTIQEVTPGLYQVLGSHTYAVAGPYQITVTVLQGWDVQEPAARKEEAGQVGAPPITGPSTVPGNSRYQYTVTFPATQNASKPTFTVDNDVASIVSQEPISKTQDGVTTFTGYTAVVQFTNKPAIVNIGMKDTRVNGAPFSPQPKRVSVVKVSVEAPVAPYKLFNPSMKAYGRNLNPLELVKMSPIEKDNLMVKVGDVPNLNDRRLILESGIEWAAKVVLEGPPQNPDAVRRIHVGFIQHITNWAYSAVYEDGSKLTANVDGKKLLDAVTTDPSQDAYYWDNVLHSRNGDAIPPAVFVDATANHTSEKIYAADSIGRGFPLKYKESDLAKTNLILAISLDVAAETLDTRAAGAPIHRGGGVGGAQQYYFPEAKARYEFVGSGEMNPNWTSKLKAFLAMPIPWKGVYADWAKYQWYTDIVAPFVPEDIAGPISETAMDRLSWLLK